MSIDFSHEEAQQSPLVTSALLQEDSGEGSLRPKRLQEYIGTFDRRLMMLVDKALAISIGISKKD